MKQVSTWLIVSLALLALLCGYVYLQVKPVLYGDITANHASSMRSYAIEHDYKLPQSWQDFVTWQARQDPEYKVTADEFDSRFRILEFDLRAGDESTIYIEILDPELKNMEGFVNSTVRSAIHQIAEQDAAPNH